MSFPYWLKYASLKDFTTPTTGRGRAVVAFWPWPDAEDRFLISIFPDGPEAYPGLTQHQMRLGFHKQVADPKAMLVFSPPKGPDDPYWRQTLSAPPQLYKSWEPVHWYDLSRPIGGLGPTLSFSKKQWWYWRNVCVFDSDEFWNVFRGKMILFNWIDD